jgi:hypothetical protein
VSEPSKAELETEMAAAIAAEDFERAAQLRDALVRLGDGSLEVPGSRIKRQVPGKMGLGTDQQVYAPPKGWVAPERPAPLTANHRGRSGPRHRS